MTVVMTKCELRYIQLVMSISHTLLAAQACTEGSTNRCSERSIEITSRAFANALATRPSTWPRTSR